MERPKTEVAKKAPRAKKAAKPAEDAAGGTPPQPSAPPPGKVECYFDTLKGGFYFKNALGEFQKTDKETLGWELRAQGYFKSYQHFNGLTYLEQELLRIVKEQSVHFAGALGGYGPGRYDIFTTRVLITTGPKFLTPTAGQWPFFKSFLSQLLGDQARYFCAWVKWAQDSLRRGVPWSTGQMLAVAGEMGCGKSFLQTLITPMLGGRVSKPYKYLTASTDFNADVFEAEHALIGDEVPKTDAQSRRNLGSALKNLVANKEQHIHPKGKQPITLTPFVRVSMSLNDNADSLMALPPLDSDVADKIILLKANPVKFPFPSKRFPESQDYYRQLVAELPAFMHSLRRWKIPESIRCQRYGVKSYHDPSLLEKVDELAPESKLWDMIQRQVFGNGFNDEWFGRASELEALLWEKDKIGECGRLFRWNSACAQLLAKLAEKMPKNVESSKKGGNRVFFKIRNTP